MKLAEIQTINEITPIEGADRIEIAKVQGWQSVVVRGQYNVGDRIIFIPIDTVLQPAVWNSYLHDKQDPTKPIRVRTIRLKGVVSQGLIFPLRILPEEYINSDIGTDISSIINVLKYEKPVPAQLAGQVKGNFPTHLVSKTDEDNLKSNIKVLEELKNCDTIVITEKCDGTSATFIKELDGTFRVCSRNLELKDTEENIYWKMTRKYDLYNLMDNGMVIAGEIVGNGIQGNPMKLKDVELFVFNIKTLNDDSYLSYDDMCLKLKNTNLNVVKVITKITNNDIKAITLDYLQKLANEQKYGNSPAEGIVIRGYKNNKTVYSQKLQKMLSVKIINEYYKD